MIAPTPPAANLDSQLMRVWVSEPSSLSNRPEMLERKIRFLTVRLRKWSGVEDRVIGHASYPLSPRARPRPAAPAPRRAPGTAPKFRVMNAISGLGARGVGGVKLQHDQRASAEVAGEQNRRPWSAAASPVAARRGIARQRLRAEAAALRARSARARASAEGRRRCCAPRRRCRGRRRDRRRPSRPATGALWRRRRSAPTRGAERVEAARRGVQQSARPPSLRRRPGSRGRTAARRPPARAARRRRPARRRGRSAASA